MMLVTLNGSAPRFDIQIIGHPRDAYLASAARTSLTARLTSDSGLIGSVPLHAYRGNEQLQYVERSSADRAAVGNTNTDSFAAIRKRW